MMANPNGRKGAAFELGVLKWLRSKGVSAERLRLSGTQDEGDLVAVVAGKTYIFELKNRKSISLPQFWQEAVAEAENYAKARALAYTPPAYVIVKRRNHPIEKAFVICDLDQWLELAKENNAD
ncbi:MAG: Propionibacterium phage [Pseudomonadota bacterium]|jgi:Holliday junction resolvase